MSVSSRHGSGPSQGLQVTAQRQRLVYADVYKDLI